MMMIRRVTTRTMRRRNLLLTTAGSYSPRHDFSRPCCDVDEVVIVVVFLVVRSSWSYLGLLYDDNDMTMPTFFVSYDCLLEDSFEADDAAGATSRITTVTNRGGTLRLFEAIQQMPGLVSWWRPKIFYCWKFRSGSRVWLIISANFYAEVQRFQLKSMDASK